jgi:putative cardiolipin synthase
MGIYVDSPELAGQVARFLDRNLPDYAYRLVVNDTGELEWHARQQDQEVIYREEPDVSFWRRFSAGFYSLLPIEEQL